MSKHTIRWNQMYMGMSNHSVEVIKSYVNHMLVTIDTEI